MEVVSITPRRKEELESQVLAVPIKDDVSNGNGTSVHGGNTSKTNLVRPTGPQSSIAGMGDCLLMTN